MIARIIEAKICLMILREVEYGEISVCYKKAICHDWLHCMVLLETFMRIMYLELKCGARNIEGYW